MKYNFPKNASLARLDELAEWVKRTSSARWVIGKMFEVHDGKLCLSSLEINNEEDAVYCCLTFGIVRVG